MAKIIQREDKRLRLVATPVGQEEFDSPELKNLIRKLSQALAAEEDGVAIAAPQLGISKRVFLVSKKLKPNTANRDLVFINPEIKQTSRRRLTMEEGCLSIRWLYGKTKRAEKVTIEAYDEQGRKFTRHGSGVWAQVFQHEIDHLNGILFIDQATDIKEIKPKS